MSDVSPIPRIEAIDLSGDGDYTCNPPCRGVILGGSGVLNVVMASGTEPQLTNTLPVGYNPLRIRKILASNTTATDITVYW